MGMEALGTVRFSESARAKEIPDASLTGLTSGISVCGCREGLFFRLLLFFVVIQFGYLFFG